MTRLSVNVNKVALLRNARGGNLPDLAAVVRDCEEFGAQGITIHPRPDERHIRYRDIPVLKEIVSTELNIEGYPDDRFMEAMIRHRPHQCTLVPDPPGALTSESGWDTLGKREFLEPIIGRLQTAGIRVSLFIDPQAKFVDGAKACGADRVELYTGKFAAGFQDDKNSAVLPHINCALRAKELAIGLNAGHDLNLQNLTFYLSRVPEVDEVSIGHALICDSLYYGLENVIGMYLQKIALAGQM